MPRGSADDDVLVIDAGHEMRAKATGVDLLKGCFFGGSFFIGKLQRRQVDGFAIRSRCRGDVLCVLVASFDFQTGDSNIYQFGNLFDCVKVPW